MARAMDTLDLIPESLKRVLRQELAKGTRVENIDAKFGASIAESLATHYESRGYPIVDGRIDLHAWCVEKDGSIYDPDFPEYEAIKAKHQYIPTDAPRIYEELTGQAKRETWTKVWRQLLKPRLDLISADQKRLLFETVSATPLHANCFLNAWSYSQITGARFTIGKMGWRKHDGEPYWEFG